MNEMLAVLECSGEDTPTDHTVNTVTAVATCACGAETTLTVVELMDLIA